MNEMDELAGVFEKFDFQVEIDDFFLYELDRLIDEDRASFDDEEFRKIIDEGIHYHIEERLEVRTRMAVALRSSLSQLGPATQKVAQRTLRTLENIEMALQNASVVVRAYAAYMFRRLQDAADEPAASEAEARALIERWQRGEILREQLTARLRQIGRPAVGPLADLLFDAPDDFMSAETAIDSLATIHSSSSARILAHAILEPILDESLEMKAYRHTRSTWPAPRPYILFMLKPHAHEDLPFRWYQLLVECDELQAADIILDEVLVHAEDTPYREDLQSIIELLRLSRDPDVEAKLIAVLNAPETSDDAINLLEEFAAHFRASPQWPDSPWSREERLALLNKQYLAAAKLLDSGKREQAIRTLDEILKIDSSYPFALALKQFVL